MATKTKRNKKPVIKIKQRNPQKATNIPKELTEAQKEFCRQYIIDWNGTRSYLAAYPRVKTNESARVNASKLLTKTNINDYINSIKAKLEEQAGITKLRVLLEHKKLAFSSIAHLHETWIERKEFESLTNEQKECISEIDTKVETRRTDEGYSIDIQFVKIKLYDKQKALDSITKLMGYDEPEKVDVSNKDGSLTPKYDLSKLSTATIKELINAGIIKGTADTK